MKKIVIGVNMILVVLCICFIIPTGRIHKEFWGMEVEDFEKEVYIKVDIWEYALSPTSRKATGEITVTIGEEVQKYEIGLGKQEKEGREAFRTNRFVVRQNGNTKKSSVIVGLAYFNEEETELFFDAEPAGVYLAFDEKKEEEEIKAYFEEFWSSYQGQ